MTKRTRILAGAAALVAVAAIAFLSIRARKPGAGARKKDARPPVALSVAELPPTPSAWVDVHAPDKAWRALRANAWVGKAAGAPLGQGLAGGWGAFLSTKGVDLAGAFEGMVIDVVADRLLADPFRVVFYAGPGATGAPALLVPRPSGAAQAAYELLEGAARRGSFEAPRCPGPEPEKGPPVPAPILVSRWLVADQALFAGQRDGRMALARNPTAVVQALCAAPPEVRAGAGVDVTVSFSRDALGRELQLAATLLGLGPTPQLTLGVEGDALVPRGFAGELGEPGRLAAAAPPEQLLQLVPADAGVVFLATLQLPEKLTRETLKQHLAKGYAGALAPRPVALVWNPRGHAGMGTEVALAWPERDAALLREAFTGPNRLERRRACGHEIYASTGALAGALQQTCEGKAPSLLHAAPAVADGLRQPTSIGLGLNVGLVLSRLLGDSYASDPEAARKAAPEIDGARRLLEELPFVGFRGVAQGGALVPGGFRS